MCYNASIKSARFLRALANHVRLLCAFCIPNAVAGHPGFRTGARPPRGPPNPFNSCKSVLALLRSGACVLCKDSPRGADKSRNSSLITRHCSQVLCFHTLAHSFALFCIGAKLNPFLSNRFRTLCSKTRGGGVCLTSLLRYLLTSLPPETATPFPQRWGQLRKGRTVFRREDRVQR